MTAASRAPATAANTEMLDVDAVTNTNAARHGVLSKSTRSN